MLEQGADAGPALPTALPTAAEVGNLPVLRLLLDWGADISTWGGWALLSALSECQTEAACLLLGAGPPDYFMPAHPGIQMDNLDRWLDSYLREHGHQQASALLQAAVQHGHTGFAQMLKQRGVVLPAGQLSAQDLQQEAA
jgi:hypothetical protein